MRFQGALVREQGTEFTIVVVKQHVLTNQGEARQATATFRQVFPDVPIVLMAQDHGGVPTYLGRKDIVRFLVSVPMNAIPWKEYTVG